MHPLRNLLLIAAVLSAWFSVCTPAVGAETNFVSDTILRSYERDKSTKSNIAVIPVYEYMQLETGSLSKPGLSVHAYGWSRIDAGDRQFFTDNDTGELLYGFLEYTDDRHSFNARLGRQNLFGGPANEIIDGVSLRGDIVPTLAVTLFGGLPTSLAEVNGTSGDMVYGGKLSHRFKDQHSLALSYKKIENNSLRDDEIVGLDMFFALPRDLDLSGMSTRSMVTNDWREHFYEARFAVKEVAVRPYFQQIEYEDLFNTNANSANPFRYLAGTGERLATAGFDLSWMGLKGWEFGMKGKQHNFAERSGDAYYLSGLATWHSEEMSLIGLESGIMEGDDPRDEYLLARVFCHWDKIPFELPVNFVTSELVYVDYGRQINNKGDSLFLSLGGGKRFFSDALEVKLSGDYSSDPYYRADYRSTLVVTYRYAVINEAE